jgi:AAHS family 4-hydroxybenzoate transporter-like MFS transporter
MQEAETASPLEALIDGAPITPIQAVVVLLCTVVTLIEGIDLNLIPLLAPAIAKAWSIPSTAFGVIFAAGPIGLIAGGFGVGYVADRFGRRPALIGAMVLMTVSTLATSFAANPGQLMILRVLTGIGFGGVIPAAAALVSEFLPTRTRASVVAFVCLGQALGGLVASLLMKTSLALLGWQTIILYMGGVCGLGTVLLFAMLPESPRYLMLRFPEAARTAATLGRLKLKQIPPAPDAAARVRGRVRDLFTGGRALGTCLLWATFIGICAPVSFFTSWLTLIYTYAGQPAANGVSAAAAYWAGGIVGGLLLPLLCAVWSVDLVLMAVVLGAAVSSAALGMVLGMSELFGLCAAFSCGVFISGAFYLMYPPAVRFYQTAIRSTGIGAAVAFGRIGNTISPLAAGLMLSAGLRPATIFWCMALPLVISFAAMGAFHWLTQVRGKAAVPVPV